MGNKICINCGKRMKQQFIGLQHCKCGITWKKDMGYFKRTPDMVFCLERHVTKKGKNSIRTKQVPSIRFKESKPQYVDFDETDGFSTDFDEIVDFSTDSF